MQFLSCHNGQLLKTALAEHRAIAQPRTFTTKFPQLDRLLPHGGFVFGAIHEILSHKHHGLPRFFALLLARAAMQTGAIVCCDPTGELYPPAVASMGIPLEHLYLLHPGNLADQSWAVAECMRCKGVGVTIAPVNRMSRIEARRFQLAAERGGGVGILLRPLDKTASIYAAATRWLVAPASGERTVQRWKIQLIHGHGGLIGQSVILEHHRDTNKIEAHPVHPSLELADRPAPAVA